MNKPAPIFLHGFSGGGASLQEFATLCFPGQEPICIDLPGFGTSEIKNKDAETNALVYLDEVWDLVRQAAPGRKVHLVGHSYGAVLAFALASMYPNIVVRVDLFMPSVRTRFMSFAGLLLASILQYIPGGIRLLKWVFQREIFVDAVTKSMEHENWTEARRRQIKAMRRQEAQEYTPQMFRLSLHTLHMPKALRSIRCSVPVRLVQANDDTVAALDSAKWIKERSENISTTVTYGGHLSIVAEPERLARILYSAR